MSELNKKEIIKKLEEAKELFDKGIVKEENRWFVLQNGITKEEFEAWYGKNHGIDLYELDKKTMTYRKLNGVLK